MAHRLKKEGKYSYLEIGEGTPIVIMHGLMGGLSNFDGVVDFLLRGITLEFFSPQVLLSMVFLSAAIGWFGSLVSINQFLRSELNT